MPRFAVGRAKRAPKEGALDQLKTTASGQALEVHRTRSLPGRLRPTPVVLPIVAQFFRKVGA